MSSPESYPAKKSRQQYCFANFTLDGESGFLRRGPEEIPLRPKALEVLTYLVEHHGCLVTKTDLMSAVWPDTAVTDNCLARSLLEIRRALDDDCQHMIRTVPRRGYVFTCTVTTPLVEVVPQPVASPAESRHLPALPQPPTRKLANRIFRNRVTGALVVS